MHAFSLEKGQHVASGPASGQGDGNGNGNDNSNAEEVSLTVQRSYSRMSFQLVQRS